MNNLISKNELSKILNVTITTISNMMNKGMPYYKVGKAVRFDIEEVKEWLRKKG